MTKEKQIEELAKICASDCGNCRDCPHFHKEVNGLDSCYYRYAEMIYDAGYRKQSEGEWIGDYDSGGYVLSCSLCGEHYWIEDEHGKKPNFCPHCGAKMKGEE